MMSFMERWTIRELAAKVAAALDESGYEAPDNGQIAAIPSARTIRYYTALGLLDRPADMRGRTALYDRRHLAQLVAIKQLQVEGKPLAEIQSTLAGAAPSDVERIARLPEGGARAERTTSERDARFWMAEPAEPAEPEPAEPEPEPEPAQTAEPAADTTHQTIELAPGLLLVVDLREHPRPSARALQHAAAAITAALR
jgi:DNA-binding transcriptional MerR regulator